MRAAHFSSRSTHPALPNNSIWILGCSVWESTGRCWSPLCLLCFLNTCCEHSVLQLGSIPSVQLLWMGRAWPPRRLGVAVKSKPHWPTTHPSTPSKGAPPQADLVLCSLTENAATLLSQSWAGVLASFPSWLIFVPSLTWIA